MYASSDKQGGTEQPVMCRAADDVALEKSRNGRGGSGRVDLDPWLTESRVVSAHTSLHATQVKSNSPIASDSLTSRNCIESSFLLHIMQDWLHHEGRVCSPILLQPIPGQISC